MTRIRRATLHARSRVAQKRRLEVRRDRRGFTMPLGEAMETQRAIRRLKPDPVDDGLVLRLIELALRAPTGSNAQHWEFIVVRAPKIKEGLARLNRTLWLPD